MLLQEGLGGIGNASSDTAVMMGVVCTVPALY